MDNIRCDLESFGSETGKKYTRDLPKFIVKYRAESQRNNGNFRSIFDLGRM